MLTNTNVKVTVAPDGTTKFDFNGFSGANCLAEAEAIKAVLAQFGVGVEQLEFQAKPELLAAQLQVENSQLSQNQAESTGQASTLGSAPTGSDQT